MSDDTELEELRRRVARLEEIEAIKALKIQYGRYCDPTHDLDGMSRRPPAPLRIVRTRPLSKSIVK